MKKSSLLLFFFCLTSTLFSQNYPWERPLKMAWSNDGTTFNNISTFQDSSGVPSVIRWKGDTLICAFQWFRAPVGATSWDRVAVKFSYDNGQNWTNPTPIVINGLPSNYQRPFDPTLVVFAGDSIRIYFSSSPGQPMGGLDSTVNNYSAKTADGINYTFEANPRVDELHNRVIDPAVIFFKNAYHFISPIGSPQQGAYHYVAPDGLNFMKVPDIISDASHNWTGNYMVNDTNDLRFYGSGTSNVWFNTTTNGGVWNGYVNTNIQGGDPSVLKIAPNSYLMIYVGAPYTTGLAPESEDKLQDLVIYPNPVTNQCNIKVDTRFLGTVYTIYDYSGKVLSSGIVSAENMTIDLGNLPEALYLLMVGDKEKQMIKFLKL